MKKLALVFLAALLALEFVSAKVFYFADEADYRNNVNYALSHPYSGIDPDIIGDFDRYSCMSLDDYNRFANAGRFDSYGIIDSGSAGRDDLKRLRRADQLRIVDEDQYDSLDRDDIDDGYDNWGCYTLKDYNSLARQNQFDRKEVVDFTDYDHLEESRRIGKYRYNNFFSFPDDFEKFNLQNARSRHPYYSPYDYRDSPYPLYGYGVVRIEDY
ncbi:MAG: hypothetical protein QXM31_01955 [Candidatus Woesearchaeota archaeon]